MKSHFYIKDENERIEIRKAIDNIAGIILEKYQEGLKEHEKELLKNYQKIRNRYQKLEKIKEKDVLEMRYGLGVGNEKVQREIADMMGISRSYISRIEKKVIKKLNEELIKKNIDFNHCKSSWTCFTWALVICFVQFYESADKFDN
jgi:RNA polymerase sporulation-specific sigma factor